MTKSEPEPDPVMIVVLARFEKSGMTFDTLGQKMGYPKEFARKSAWQFIHTTKDPRMSMLRKFVDAIGTSLKSLV